MLRPQRRGVGIFRIGINDLAVFLQGKNSK
jgi:hypothetical protein